MTNEQLRKAILTITDEADQQNGLPMQTLEYFQPLGYASPDAALWHRVRGAIEYLTDKGFIKSQRLPLPDERSATHMVTAITALGRDFLEASSELTLPNAGQHIVFNAPVGAAQFGSHNTASVVQHVNPELQELIAALAALKEAAAHDEFGHAVTLLASESIAEIRNSGTITSKVRSLISGIGSGVQTLGAVLPAYQTVYLIASALGVHGLPPPPTAT